MAKKLCADQGARPAAEPAKSQKRAFGNAFFSRNGVSFIEPPGVPCHKIDKRAIKQKRRPKWQAAYLPSPGFSEKYFSNLPVSRS